MEPERFDAIVLGTGQAGKPLALDLGGAGRRTAVVEREYVGGTCVNVGCTPTKTMVASARVAYLARRAAEFGVRCGPVAVDLAQVLLEEFRPRSVTVEVKKFVIPQARHVSVRVTREQPHRGS